MSMITEQINQIKDLRDSFFIVGNKKAEKILDDAIDTIRVQSAKIHAYAMERSTAYYIVNSAYFPEDKIHQLDLVLKGEIPKEYDILAYKKAFEDIRAEIKELDAYSYKEGAWYLDKALSVIDKHDPSKAGKENNG